VVNEERHSRLRRWLRRAAIGLAAAAVVSILAFAALWRLFPYDIDAFDRAVARRNAASVLDRTGKPLRCFLGDEDTWQFPVALSDMSPHLPSALIAVEDERFRLHPGVDPISMGRAALSNIRRRRVVSGASTLTMQVVRLVRPRPRTLKSKAVETFRALQLERIKSKNEILETYLNLAPFGGNRVGVEAASRCYFAKSASDLTLSEAALLAGLVQSPSRLRPDRHLDRACRRRDHVLDRMVECGVATAEEAVLAKRRPLRIAAAARSFDAPHFARWVRAIYPDRVVSRTTLDRWMQEISETALRDAVDWLRPDGVTNGAVVAIENATGAVRAMVGSSDFFSMDDDGQVNGALALRSPGSALKPFIYAVAFDRGFITPDTALPDVPSSFSGYRPENYDREFRGPVSARRALAYSLNVPAVSLLNDVGVVEAHETLCRLGMTTMNRSSDEYGLPLALGGAPVTLLELTNAYAALARLGVWRPWRILEKEPPDDGRRVFSEGAAYLIADILRDTSRLGDRSLWKSQNTARPMAWKTGTSYGHRDAWTVAYNSEYTVGVWMGNFDGRPSRALVGMLVAAPVAARVLDGIMGPHAPVTWFAKPETVLSRKVCPLSGMPAGPDCPSAITGIYLKGVSRSRPCTVHRRVPADAVETASRVVERWPAGVAAWLRTVGRGEDLAPLHSPAWVRANRSSDTTAIRILNPADGATYSLSAPGLEEPQRIALRAAATAGRVHWFVNGTLYRTARPDDQILLTLQRGRQQIVCADDAGRNCAVAVNVR